MLQCTTGCCIRAVFSKQGAKKVCTDDAGCLCFGDYNESITNTCKPKKVQEVGVHTQLQGGRLFSIACACS